jgi:hypothetical protein
MAAVNTFKSAVPRIRDIFRSPGVSITGMESMHHMCIYLLSRYITRKRAASLRVPDEFTWEALIEGFKKNGGTQNALDSFYNEHEDCLVKHFYRLFGTEKHHFDLTDVHKHQEILQILDAVDMEKVECEIDILGWVYEQHLSTGSSSASRDLGQYFTKREICMFMIELCKPTIKDGVPESVCDPTMGTGGFLTAYKKYFNKHFPDASIDWSKTIHGCDTDPRVAALCKLNLFMETGGTCMTNVIKHDSLYGGLPLEYDIILANMPFGLKGINYENCCERVAALNIKGTKSEPLFLQLLMVYLKMGGRCAVVVPDGMMVNISACHVKTRKYLVDNFEVRRIIKLKGKLFMNTAIEPSIIFFERTGKPTEVVEFWVKDEEGETMVAAVPRSKFNDTCSFDARRYIEAPTAAPSEFPLVTLSSVLHIVGGKQNSERSDDFQVPYYESNGVVGYVAEPLYTGQYIITAGRLSIGAVHYVDGPFYPSNNTVNFTSQDTAALSNKFFYYWLFFNNHVLKDLAAGIIPMIRKSDVAEIKMPLPPLVVQDEIVATLDRIQGTELADTLRMTDKAMDLVFAAPDGAKLKPIVATQSLIRKSSQMVADIKALMAAIVKASCSSKFPLVTLSSVCKVSFGDRITQKEHTGTIYPVYGSGGETFKTDHFNRTGLTCKIGRFALSESNMVMMVQGPYWLMDSGFTVESKEPDIMATTFLWYCLRMDKKRLASLSTGSCQKNIDMASFYGVDYHCPPLVVQEEVVARLDALQSQLAALESLQRQSEDNARFILQSYLE